MNLHTIHNPRVSMSLFFAGTAGYMAAETVNAFGDVGSMFWGTVLFAVCAWIAVSVHPDAEALAAWEESFYDDHA